MTDISTWAPPANAIPLWPEPAPGYQSEYQQAPPTLTPYLLPGPAPRAAVVVLPGGGYWIKAAHEAGPVAEWLNQIGLSAFVLDYRTAPYRHPIPLLDARRAIQLVRCQASTWNIDPARVGILGFSAGGHLAATTGTHFEALDIEAPQDEAAGYDFRPNAMILCYPVISFGPHGHQGSYEALFGPTPPESAREAFSNETQVSEHTPPAFLWHTADDAGVPVENSLMFASALRAKRIPFDLHVFAQGEHGIGLAEDHPSAAPWTGLCEHWLRNLGWIDPR